MTFRPLVNVIPKSCLCSIIGAVILAVGFYICMWGRVKEEAAEDFSNGSLESGSAEHVPLLQWTKKY